MRKIVVLNEVYKILDHSREDVPSTWCALGWARNRVQAETGHVVGLNDVSFSVKKGEIFVVMGLSGSGKSTAIRTVNKLHDITYGSVMVDSTDVQQLNGSDLQAFRREYMGMVFQHFALFPHRNVIDNVGYGLKVQKVAKRVRDEAAMRALALVGLDTYSQNLPSELSGGDAAAGGPSPSTCVGSRHLVDGRAFQRS